MTGAVPSLGPISLQQVRTKHSRFSRRLTQLVDEVAKEGGEQAKRHVFQAPHFHPRTGALQRATTYRIVRVRSGRLIKVLNTKPYAASIDLGARPHVIRARRAKALRFTWPKFWSIQTTSAVWFLRSVNHPGNRPYRFLWHATYGAYRFAGHRLRAGAAQLARNF